jgi:hypothetical protein
MKKSMSVGILLALSSSSAFAEPPVTCTTNINHNLHVAATTFMIQSNVVGQKLVLMETSGGRSRNNGPVSFPVAIQTRGPEVIDYYNAEKDFALMINYHPVNGQIQGVFTGEINGRRVQTLVSCEYVDPVQS